MGLPAPASLRTVHRTVFRALASPEDISSRPNDEGSPVTHIINALTEVSGDYDVLFCDVWGVVHDGVQAIPEAADALARFREAERIAEASGLRPPLRHLAATAAAPRPAGQCP